MRKVRVKYYGMPEDHQVLTKVANWAKEKRLIDVEIALGDSLGSKKELEDLSFDLIRLAPGFQNAVLNLIPAISSEIRFLNRIDTLIKLKGVFWSKNLFRSAFHELILKRATDLDTAATALIVGANDEVKIAISVLAEIGFEKISVVGSTQEEVKTFLDQFRNQFLGITFQELSQQELVLQAGIHSVCINAIELENQSPMFNDILYYNYLKQGGLVANLAQGPFSEDHKDLLLKEAKSIQSPIISRAEVDVVLELFWIDELLQAGGLVVNEGIKVLDQLA